MAKRTWDEARATSRHKLVIAGEDWSKNLINANVTYTGDAGGSGLKFEVYGHLDGYVDAPVKFFLGYEGEGMREYFTGKLQRPKNDPKLWKASGVGYGPFRVMQTQMLGENDVTFSGWSLEKVIRTLARRAGHRAGDVIVKGGNRIKVNVPDGEDEEPEKFKFNNGLMDIINGFLEKANFIAYDKPGGKRIFMPRPRPGSNGNYKRRYTPDDYISFEADPKSEYTYSRVIVFREAEDTDTESDVTTYAVFAQKAVRPHRRYHPDPYRYYLVEDFPGTQREARRECEALAQVLRYGDTGFSMEILFDKDIDLYDGFRVNHTVIRYDESRLTKHFVCVVDDTIDVKYEPGSAPRMTLKGSAYEMGGERKLYYDHKIPNEASSVIWQPRF